MLRHGETREAAEWRALEEWGLTAAVADQLEPADAAEWVVGRVVRWEGTGGLVVTPEPMPAEIRGKARRTETGLPVAGDWVLASVQGERIVVQRILGRQTVLVRQSAGGSGAPQVVVANVDVLFIVTSANRDLNERRLERYLTAAWESGARPVIVLNKVDLSEDVELELERIRGVAPGVGVVGMSALNGHVPEALAAYVGHGVTAGLVGSSGVGKSTLINAWLGGAVQETSGLDATQRGRHTTTQRSLFRLNSGGILVDTPGMREFGLANVGEGLDAAFEDIATLAGHCRFSDCSHAAEPGCAVRDAVATGALSAQRLDSYVQLQREAEVARARSDARAAQAVKRQFKARSRAIRAHYRSQPKAGKRP